MGVVFNCRKESASQKSMKSNNGQLSKNEVVGSFLMPVFYFWTAEQPSLALRAPSLCLPHLVQPQRCVLGSGRRGDLSAALTKAPPRGGGGVSGALTTASVSGQGGQAWGQCVS